MGIAVFLMDDTGNVTVKFHLSKALSNNKISMHVLHLFHKSVCKLFNIVFKSCLMQCTFY